MPEVDTETVHKVKLSAGEIKRLLRGNDMTVNLDDGSTLQLHGERDRSQEEGVGEDDVRELVEEAGQDVPEEQQEDAPRGSGLIKKNPEKG